MSSGKRFLSVILAIVMVFSTLVVGVSAYDEYKGSAIKDQYNKVDKPVLTTAQYASAVVDELDRMLSKENLKMTSDELYGIGSLDLTSVDATMKSVYDFVNGSAFSAFKGMLGDLGNLTANSFKDVTRASAGDLGVLYAVLGFLNENTGIFVSFVDGSINLGSVLPALLGEDLEEYQDVSKLLKSMLYEEVYTTKTYEVQPDGTTKKVKNKPDMDSEEHKAGLAASTFDGLVQKLIDKSVLEDYPELTGYTDVSKGTMYSLIDNVLKALFNGYLLDELNGSIKDEIKKLCGVEFKKDSEGKYVKDEDGNKVEDNRDNLNSYANYLNIDYEYKGYEFESGSVLSQLNNILGSFLKVFVKDQSLINWKTGDNSVLMDNLVGLAKTVLLDFGSDFFAPYIKLADEATINKMSNEELIVYALRAIINSFVEGMYIPDDVVTVVDFGYYALSQLLATEVPELDFSNYAKNTDTLIVMAIDYGIYSINRTVDMGLSYAYSLDDVDAQIKIAAQYGIENYGGLLNGITLSTNDSGWTTLDKIVDGLIGLDWLPTQANKSMKTFLYDCIIGNIADLDLKGLLDMFEASSFSSASPLKMVPQTAVINLVVKIVNAIFPGAFVATTSFDNLVTNKALSLTIKALFNDLYDYRVELMQGGLGLACMILGLTSSQEFKFPTVTNETFYYSSTGTPNFTIKFRNNSSGINTGYTDAKGVFHQDQIFTYDIKSITSNTSGLTLSSDKMKLEAGQEATISCSGTFAGASAFIVTVTYDVLAEDGNPLTDEPLTEMIYGYLSKSTKDDSETTVTLTNGNYAVTMLKSVYAKSIGDLEDISVKLENSSTTTYNNVTALAAPKSGSALNADYVSVNPDSYVVFSALLNDKGNVSQKGVANVEMFERTAAYKALSDEEKEAAWDAICSDGMSTANKGKYNYSLGVTVAADETSAGTAVQYTSGLNILCYKEYGLESLLTSEVNKHRQASNYTAGWAEWEAAMEAAVNVAYAPYNANTFLKQRATKYESVATALKAAIETLDANEKAGGLSEIKEKINALNPSNEDKTFTDADYSFFGVADFVPYTYYNYRDVVKDAQKMIDKAETPDDEGNVTVPSALDVTYMAHRLDTYSARLLSKTAIKTHLDAELKNAAAKNYNSADYTTQSWSEYQNALTFATSVNNDASSDLRQTKVNTAYEQLLECQKRLMTEDSSSTPTTPTFTLISTVQVAETTDGKILTGVRGYDELSVEEYFSALTNCTVELVKNESDAFSTGAVINVKDSTGKVVDSYIVSVTGDANGDGNCADGFDIGDISSYANALLVFEKANELAADMNNDGTVDGFDVSNAGLVAAALATIDYANRTIIV